MLAHLLGDVFDRSGTAGCRLVCAVRSRAVARGQRNHAAGVELDVDRAVTEHLYRIADAARHVHGGSGIDRELQCDVAACVDRVVGVAERRQLQFGMATRV